MSNKGGSKETLTDANSVSANSDICVVENSSDNSAKSLGWRHSPPSSTKPNYSPNSNVSPIFKDTPTPPSANRPISRLKRIIRAPSRPPSPKRPNREIVIALEKLRPVNKYIFNKPNGNSPNLKFAKEEIKFTANSSTPKRPSTQKINYSHHNHSQNRNKSNQSNQRPVSNNPPNRAIQENNLPSSPQPSTQPEILENIVIEKAYIPQSPEQREQQSHQPNNALNQQHLLQQLHEQKQVAQQQLQLIEERLHKSQLILPKQPITSQLQQHSPTQTINRMHNTSPLTPPPITPNQSYTAAAPNPSSNNAVNKETFERQFEKHIKTARKSELVVEPPNFLQRNTDTATSYPDRPQSSPTHHQKQQQTQPANSKFLTANKLNPPTTKTSIPTANNKIPSIFIPQISSIESLFNLIKNSTNPIKYTTTCGQERGLRVKCSDVGSYTNLLDLLQQNNIQLHTHQMPQDKGVRIVIKNLHATTPIETIRSLLSGLGYTTKFINVLKNKFTGIPLNIFEVEVDAKSIKNIEDLLNVKKLGSQEVAIERQAMRMDPVQCHRCQAFGHSKNYCRREFICMKCAEKHPTTACTKARSSEGTCANCGKGHVASYKGCPVYKKERERLLTVRLANQPAVSPPAYQQPSDRPPKQQPIQQNQRQQQQPTDRHPNSPQRPQALPVLANTPQAQTLTQIELIGARAGAYTPHHSSLNRITYSQATRGGIKKMGTPISSKPYTQNLPHQPHPQPQRHNKPQQQKLHQLNLPEHALYHQRYYHQQSTATQHEQNIVLNRNTNKLPQQIDLKQIQNDVTSNTQSIARLNDKIDQLHKLVHDHFQSILKNNQNSANDNLNNVEQ